MNADLARARAALDMERPDDAAVYAWKALATIDVKDAPELALIASELGDMKLLMELERRGLRFTKPLVREDEPKSKRRFVFPIVVLLVLAGAAVTQLPTERRAPRLDESEIRVRPNSHPRILTLGDGVWLVPVERADSVDLQRIADELTVRHRIPVGVQGARVTLTPSALDDSGDGLVAERLIGVLASAYGATGRATVIGVTDYDMDSPTHGHVFTLRSGRNYAIVSTAQLGATLLDRLQGDDRRERTRKLVARNIALLHLGLPMVDDPKSLRRTTMSSIDDIDELDEDF
jgi:hypothetical protein